MSHLVVEFPPEKSTRQEFSLEKSSRQCTGAMETERASFGERNELYRENRKGSDRRFVSEEVRLNEDNSTTVEGEIGEEHLTLENGRVLKGKNVVEAQN